MPPPVTNKCGGFIMLSGCPSVRECASVCPSVHACVLLVQYLTNQWTEFHQSG